MADLNRFILKYAYPITFVILAILAWAAYRQFSAGGSGLIGYIAIIVLVWGIGTYVFLYLWPTFTYSAYKRAIVQHGLGGGPIPINTLYATPHRASPTASTGSLLATGTDDVLYVGGLLDLSKGALDLHVPDMAGRYYSVQFTDPSNGTNFAYVGKRVTGTKAGEYLISGPGWKGTAPPGMTQIAAPNNSVLAVGRVFVASDSDLPTAYGLAQQIQFTPFSH
jgi:hypothetical protein